MRYKSWDVLLFPGSSKIPQQEFKTSCHVIPDLETEHLQPNSLLPTMTCFIPSLEAGHNFRVSIHSWENPEISFNTLGLRRIPDKVFFEARLFIDGIESGSKKFVKNGPWPTVIENSTVANKLGQFEPLKFPVFHQELLSQSYWSPIDNLGRLRVVLSEGFTRENDNLYERVRNIISFSFQHAPLHLLEKSSIAWPNASMWQQPTHVEIQQSRDCSPAYTENISDARSQTSSHMLTDTQISDHQNHVLTPKAPIQEKNIHEDHLTESTSNIFKNWNESTVDFFALEYFQPDSLTHSLSLPVSEFLSNENTLENICENIFASPVGNNITQHDENISKEVDIIAPNKIMLCGFEDHDLAMDENYYPTLDPDMFSISKADKIGIPEYRTESESNITCSDPLLAKEKQSFSLALPGSQDTICSENARNPG